MVTLCVLSGSASSTALISKVTDVLPSWMNTLLGMVISLVSSHDRFTMIVLCVGPLRVTVPWVAPPRSLMAASAIATDSDLGSRPE